MSTRHHIPLAVPDLRGKEVAYLRRCVEDNWVSSAGPFVRDFEQQVAALSKRDHGVATANGTTALQLSLTALGIGAGDLVVVPDWTFAATANAVIHTGAKPLFVDITAHSWTLDPAILVEALERFGGRIKAVIPVHALGHAADMDPILEICKASDIPVIEDAAGALGARYKNRPVGSFGRAAMFSFNGNKTVTTGGGGMIVTDDASLAETMRHLSTQARTGADYDHDAIGFNFRMTNLNAAVGLAQLERLEEMLRAKRAIAMRYDAALGGRLDLSPMPRQSWAEHSCWLYSVAAGSRSDVDSLIAHLAAKDIEARRFWLSLCEQDPYREMPRIRTGVSNSLSGRVVSLPCSSSLTERQQLRVIDALHGWRGSKLPAAA